MTAFADFIDLQTAVVEHVRNPSIADVFPRLVKLAEVGFNRRLRCREQISTATVTISGGAGVLPADMAEIIGVYDAAGMEYIAQPLQAVVDERHGFRGTQRQHGQLPHLVLGGGGLPIIGAALRSIGLHTTHAGLVGRFHVALAQVGHDQLFVDRP
jgi:hypothetical protein